jgi:hypothetical protein
VKTPFQARGSWRESNGAGIEPKPSEEAKAAFSKLVPAEPAVTLKPMVDQLSAFVNGNMFCGLFGDELVVRLPELDIARVKRQGGRDAC